MKTFPFTEDEWETIREAALGLLNATFTHDTTLADSCRIELFARLNELRRQHGEHPKLLETQADFTSCNSERASLYQQATQLAETNDLHTVTIRLSYARVLLDLDQPQLARRELLACELELLFGDDSDRREWAELFAETW